MTQTSWGVYSCPESRLRENAIKAQKVRDKSAKPRCIIPIGERVCWGDEVIYSGSKHATPTKGRQIVYGEIVAHDFNEAIKRTGYFAKIIWTISQTDNGWVLSDKKKRRAPSAYSVNSWQGLTVDEVVMGTTRFPLQVFLDNPGKPFGGKQSLQRIVGTSMSKKASNIQKITTEKASDLKVTYQQLTGNKAQRVKAIAEATDDSSYNVATLLQSVGIFFSEKTLERMALND